MRAIQKQQYTVMLTTEFRPSAPCLLHRHRTTAGLRSTETFVGEQTDPTDEKIQNSFTA